MCIWLCSLMLVLYVCSLSKDPSRSVVTWIWEVDCLYPLCSPRGPKLPCRCSNIWYFLSYIFFYLSLYFLYLLYLAFLIFRDDAKRRGHLFAFFHVDPDFYFLYLHILFFRSKNSSTMTIHPFHSSITYLLSLPWVLMSAYQIPLSSCISLSMLWTFMYHHLLVTLHGNILLCWRATPTFSL